MELELLWTEIERALIAASLAEIDVGAACDRMCGALSRHLGTEQQQRCVLIDGHHLGPPSSSSSSETLGNETRLLIGCPAEGNAATLVLSPALASPPPFDIDRLKRLFVLLLNIAHHRPPSSPSPTETIHALRNQVAGLQANLELIEMAMAPESGLSLERQHDEIKSALEHALDACRKMAVTITESAKVPR